MLSSDRGKQEISAIVNRHQENDKEAENLNTQIARNMGDSLDSFVKKGCGNRC